MNSVLTGDSSGKVPRGRNPKECLPLDIQQMIGCDRLNNLINEALDSAHSKHIPGKCYCKPMQIGRAPCSHCNGQGVVPLPGVGETLRAMRLARGVTLGQFIVYFTRSDHHSYSKAHVVNLEKGRDVFSLQLIEKYQKALQKAAKVSAK